MPSESTNPARLKRIALAAALSLLAFAATALEVSNKYRSPRNPERQVRKATELIVLHTTEAPERSSLTKVSERGECHFVVGEDGTIYRIIDRDKEAFHAGRSMWNGKEDVDKFSIGIECVGYHDKEMGILQLRAISRLVKELQKLYGIPDGRVVAHSHVAYGAPNNWQKQRHRGRKRCGMLFAMPSVRRVLGLKARPALDPDTKARRLVVGDEYLSKVLYGTVDTFVKTYAGQAVPASGPVASAKPAAKPQGSQDGGILGWLGLSGDSAAAARPPPSAGAKPAATAPTAGSRPAAKTPPRSVAELKAAGYRLLGSVTRSTTASSLAGGKWNAPDTYYTIRNKVIPGNEINPAKIEVGMSVWRR